ncbi:hypothetical protein HDU86_004210 [Geranomyces michiganensis]|nr:hypothetical protein HDU86_004210 [Geranomyces michiganensis]
MAVSRSANPAAAANSTTLRPTARSALSAPTAATASSSSVSAAASSIPPKRGAAAAKSHAASLIVQAIPSAANSSALHQKLCSKSSVRPTPTRRAKQTALPRLPTELLLVLLETMPTKQVCTMRRLSKTYATLGGLVIAKRMEEQLENLAVKDVELRGTLSAAQAEFGPHLEHYKQFLRGVMPSDLTEALWYSNPPEELRAICECLCRLKGLPPTPAVAAVRNPRSTSTTVLRSILASPRPSAATLPAENDLASSISSLQPLPWSTIKKMMGRYEFKTWLLNLQTNVDSIPHNSIRIVEHIIMIDPNINYDHVRDVSLAGYRLLILVAACLQYANINGDLKAKNVAMLKVQKTLSNYRSFIEMVECPPPVSDEMIALAAEC